MQQARFGRYPAAQRVIAHVSDTHLLAGGAPLGRADTSSALDDAVAALARAGRLDAIIVTGDIADLGELDAYARARAPLELAAKTIGARLVWVMGNHDERTSFREGLLDQAPTDDPVHEVLDVDGVRIVVFDTTVPGYHHGAVDASGAAWLASAIAEPAPQGTVLALHHAPIPTPVELMDVLELRGQNLLADVVRGSDIRVILGGHLHYPTNGWFAGVPVSVAGATAYTIDAAAPGGELVGVDGGRSFSLVHIYDHGIVTSVVPIGEFTEVSRFGAEFLEELATSSDEERLERFSRKATSAGEP